jgi:hypothetical protein
MCAPVAPARIDRAGDPETPSGLQRASMCLFSDPIIHRSNFGKWLSFFFGQAAVGKAILSSAKI